MAFTPEFFLPMRLAGPTQPGTAATTLYTAPAATNNTTQNGFVGATAKLESVTICNTTSSTTASLNLGVNGADGPHALLTGFTMQGNDTVTMDFSEWLQPGDTIQALQSVAGNFTVHCNGAVCQ